jgi:hypothetical protein
MTPARAMLVLSGISTALRFINEGRPILAVPMLNDVHALVARELDDVEAPGPAQIGLDQFNGVPS